MLFHQGLQGFEPLLSGNRIRVSAALNNPVGHNCRAAGDELCPKVAPRNDLRGICDYGTLNEVCIISWKLAGK